MSTAIERLLATAKAEEGYLEKETNSNLDNPTANAETTTGTNTPGIWTLWACITGRRTATTGATSLWTGASSTHLSGCDL